MRVEYKPCDEEAASRVRAVLQRHYTQITTEITCLICFLLSYPNKQLLEAILIFIITNKIGNVLIFSGKVTNKTNTFIFAI